MSLNIISQLYTCPQNFVNEISSPITYTDTDYIFLKYNIHSSLIILYNLMLVIQKMAETCS